jgi:hypothetical protein
MRQTKYGQGFVVYRNKGWIEGEFGSRGWSRKLEANYQREIGLARFTKIRRQGYRPTF